MKTNKPEPGSKEFLDAVNRVLKVGEKTGHMILLSSGLRAGVGCDGGYSTILIGGRKHRPEKISWLMHTGKWPDDPIGFKNGINTDFRADNLFEVITGKQVTIAKSGNLFVVYNGSEQVMTTEVLDDAVQMVRSILEG